MSVGPGERLGPYEIVAPLGSGGMGEVFRARDTRLGRTVAIKILARDLASDPDRRERFEREARAISTVSHPNICALYDVGHERNIDFLVMEFLEGETLGARLARGPLPLDQALEVASQIAAGLHEAHRLGIVHRDLKPANVMLTRMGARLLDFGVARLREPNAVVSSSNSVTRALTTEQAIVGTVSYMSPEQLQGRETDARSDIFSFGILLFEIIAGRRPFEGDNTASVMAAILERDPPTLSTTVPTVPPSVDRLIQHCLIKSPEMRWQSARDLELQLAGLRRSETESDSVRVAVARPLWQTLVAAALLLAAGLGVGFAVARMATRPGEAGAPLVQFSLPLPARESIHEHTSSSVALSHDGSLIAYAVNRDDGRGLYVRPLGAAAATWIAGSDRAASPFFSPDGQWIAFESGGSLKKVPIEGGTPVRLCDTPYFSGGSWSDDGIVLVPTFTSGLFRVSAAGGKPTRLTTIDHERGERAHVWPQALPNGRVLFTIWTGGNFDESKLALFSPATGAYTVVLEGGFHGRYAAGHLIFGRASRLFAAPFDLERGVMTGPVEQIVDGVAGDSGAGVSVFAVDDRGTVAFAPGVQRAIPRSLVTIDATGRRESLWDANRAIVTARVSPDGKRLALWIEEAVSAVWLKDLARDPLTRVTYSGDDHGPAWSPDGKWIAFESGRASTHQIFVRAADGSGSDRQITTGEHHHYLNDWSADGQALVYTEYHPETGPDLWIVNTAGTPQPHQLRATPFAEKGAALSPDGKWIAYVANDSHRNEVYVQAFSGAEQRVQISSDGGDEPAWSRKGDQLFYRNGSRMMAVSITTAPSFTAGRPVLLFEGMYHYNIGPSRAYDVMPDGRFVMVTLPDAASAPRQINVLLNRLK